MKRKKGLLEKFTDITASVFYFIAKILIEFVF